MRREGGRGAENGGGGGGGGGGEHSSASAHCVKKSLEMQPLEALSLMSTENQRIFRRGRNEALKKHLTSGPLCHIPPLPDAGADAGFASQDDIDSQEPSCRVLEGRGFKGVCNPRFRNTPDIFQASQRFPRYLPPMNPISK